MRQRKVLRRFLPEHLSRGVVSSGASRPHFIAPSYCEFIITDIPATTRCYRLP
jgi:hypothetical protein